MMTKGQIKNNNFTIEKVKLFFYIRFLPSF